MCCDALCAMAGTSLAAERVACLADECLCGSRFGLLKSSTEVEEETSLSLDVELDNPMRMMRGLICCCFRRYDC